MFGSGAITDKASSALAALATCRVTWIYNEFFRATVLIEDGTKFPITSALNNLLFALQLQFVAGLTLGASKG
jgi:multiple sugar transport system permease protein